MSLGWIKRAGGWVWSLFSSNWQTWLCVGLAVAALGSFAAMKHWQGQTYKAQRNQARTELALERRNVKDLQAAITVQNAAVAKLQIVSAQAMAKMKKARADAERMRLEADKVRQSILNAKPQKGAKAAAAWANRQYQKIVGGKK